MTGWSVMLRGIRHRSGRSLVVFLLAAFATVAAVLIPAYGRAAAQSVLTDGMQAAPITSASVTIGAEGSAAGAAGGAFDPVQQSVAEARTLVDSAFRKAPGLASVLDRPIAAVETDAQLAQADNRFATRLTWRQGACTQLVVEGECAIDAEQVVVSTRSAAEAGIQVGDRLTLRPARGEGAGRQLEVVGLYTPKDPSSIFWGNSAYFAHSAQAGETGLPRLDAIFTGSEDDVRLPSATATAVKFTYPLLPQAVRLDDVPVLKSEIGALSLELTASELQVDTALLSIVDDVAREQQALSRTVPLIAVPLLLLAWVVLFLLVAALTEERGPEVALARLRGYPNARAARFGLGETLLLIVFAAPFGLAAGLALVELTSRAMLAEGTHVEVRWPVFAAAAAGLAVACAAAWLASKKTFSLGVLELLRRIPQRTRKRAGVFEAIIVTLAAIGLVAAVRDRANPFALLAPAALALVAGIVAGRVLVWWAKARLVMARRGGNIAGILAFSQLARRPGPHRTVVVLTAAMALLGFAAFSWDVAVRARAEAARDSLGAQTVYQVVAAHPEALVAAVAAADASGHTMAVVRADEQYGQGRVELIGVQPRLLGGVVQWRGMNEAELNQIAGRLQGAEIKRAAVGADISIRVTASGLGTIPMRIGAIISAPGQPPTAVWLGDLRAGQRDYFGQTGCAADSGCRFVGLAVGRVGTLSGAVQATLSVQDIRSAAQPVEVRMADSAAWRPATDRTPGAKVTLGASPERLTATIDSTGPGDVVVSYLDTTPNLPAVLAGRVPADGGDTFVFPGFADVPQGFTVVGRADRLPRAGVHGLLFDLDQAVRSASVEAGLADVADLRYEVWAAAGAPAGLDRKLADQGLRVLSTQTIESELEQLGRRAPALGFRLFLLAGVAAAALALGVLLLGLRLGATERHAELAALRATGVKSRFVRRAVRRERFASLVIPLLIGLGTGLGSALLMLPGLPLVTANLVTPPEDLMSALMPTTGLAALPLAVAGALLIVVWGLLTARDSGEPRETR